MHRHNVQNDRQPGYRPKTAFSTYHDRPPSPIMLVSKRTKSHKETTTTTTTTQTSCRMPESSPPWLLLFTFLPIVIKHLLFSKWVSSCRRCWTGDNIHRAHHRLTDYIFVDGGSWYDTYRLLPYHRVPYWTSLGVPFLLEGDMLSHRVEADHRQNCDKWGMVPLGTRLSLTPVWRSPPAGAVGSGRSVTGLTEAQVRRRVPASKDGQFSHSQHSPTLRRKENAHGWL